MSRDAPGSDPFPLRRHGAAHRGTRHRRVLIISGNSVHQATTDAIKQGRGIAADLLNAGLPDIEYAHGLFSVAGNEQSVGGLAPNSTGHSA
jgi:hypothetical protein